jgi:hypothetical protein
LLDGQATPRYLLDAEEDPVAVLRPEDNALRISRSSVPGSRSTDVTTFSLS